MWSLSTPTLGSPYGQTSVEVVFPKAGDNFPLTFGIPLGQVQSADTIVLTDESGKKLPVSCIPLGNHETQQSRWTLISTVLSAGSNNSRQKITIRWGETVAPDSSDAVILSVEGSQVSLDIGNSSLVLSPRGIETLGSETKVFHPEQWRPSITMQDGTPLVPENGEVTVLRDTPRYKKIRFTSQLTDSLDLHQEYDIYHGSPFIRCSVRYINRSLSDIPLDGLSPLKVQCPDAKRVHVGLSGRAFRNLKTFSLIQQSHRCYGVLDEKRGRLPDDGSTFAWVSLENGSKPGMLLVFPWFRGMAAGDRELESVLSYDGRYVHLNHYKHRAPGADIRLRETMARTFTYWLVIDPPPDKASGIAEALCSPPYVVYDREYLTDMGVFQESSVSHLFDTETLDGALYFTRAQIGRAEYPRSGRGTEPGDDGEGLFEVDLHAGGMVFGEVYQYFTPKPGKSLYEHYRDKLGIDPVHIKTGGRYSYRNGDIPLALFQEYLRSGNPAVHNLAMIHSLLFADYAVSHAYGASEGVGHYYCDWYGNPYVYERFEGLLLGYLATGEPWLMEAARAMADFTIRAWEGGHPRDIRMDGSLTGVQSRSAYIAKMNLMMHDVTGEGKYLDNAVRLAEWAMSTQEPEGWWVMNPLDPVKSRAYRCTPIFAGYTVQGLWPLYERTDYPDLKNCLLKAASWFLSKQEDARGFNPGTFPNSYWYGNNGSEDNPISPIAGNYATTTHAANALLQAYLASGNQEYFYASNAAWVGVLNNQTPEGGVPLSSTVQGSVWSHVLVESLPHFAAVAEERGLPIVLGMKTGVPGTAFMGKGASYVDGVFRFEVKYRHEKPMPFRVFFPEHEPGMIHIDRKALTHRSYDEELRVVAFELPPAKEFCISEITIE